MLKGIFSSWSYLIWYAFYFLLFSLITAGFIIPFYILFLFLAFLPLSEQLWRWATGIRPLRLMAEKERLNPIFQDVYNAYSYAVYAKEGKITHAQNLKLYIQETMNINAFAFGRETLVLTKGSIDLLDDEALKGLIAHEIAHFHNHDTTGALFSYVANFPISILMKKLRKINSTLEDGFIRFFFNIIYGFFRAIEFLGDLILMHHSRKREYKADMFALKFGYGKELAEVLIQLYQISMEKPQTIGEMMRATHPPITKRIERLEVTLYSE